MSEDVNEHLIAHLKARAGDGLAKYGVPMRPFNGRNPLRDQREELLDALVYNEQDLMEREAIADLLERAGCFVNYMETVVTAEVDRVRATFENPVTTEELLDMAAKLRADCERSVPVAGMGIIDFVCGNCGYGSTRQADVLAHSAGCPGPAERSVPVEPEEGDEHFPWSYTAHGTLCACGEAMDSHENCLRRDGPAYRGPAERLAAMEGES